MAPSNDFHKIDAHTTKVGVIGSPSQTSEVQVDILSTSIDTRLVGSLTYFNYQQDNERHVALGQITEITLRNPWVEDPTMRSLIRQKGKVDPITGRQDTHTAEMSIAAVFKEDHGGYDQSEIGTIPATGTEVKLVNNDVLDHLLEDHSKAIYKIGRIYGTDTFFPAWFRHFGDISEGGVGEAYHLGIFGKTGSGKSYLAKQLLMGFATNPDMSLFVIDPQGEFYKDFQPGAKVHGFLGDIGREVEAVSVSDIVLTGEGVYDIFLDILTEAGFFHHYSVRYETNIDLAKREIRRCLLGKGRRVQTQSRLGSMPSAQGQGGRVKSWDIHKREVFDRVWNYLGQEATIQAIYRDDKAREALANSWESADSDEVLELWQSVARLFTWDGREGDARQLKQFTEELLQGDHGKTVVISLADESVPEGMYWNEDVKLLLIQRLLEGLKAIGEEAYKVDRKLNTLVLLDEAHRLAPRSTKDLEPRIDQIKDVLLDAVRTTRKQGLGWGFISQTLRSLDPELTQQLRIYVFGYGLGWGAEYRALEELIGGPALKLYRQFRDPKSSLREPKYPFMASGPISPLSFSGSPLYFTALDWKKDEPFRMLRRE